MASPFRRLVCLILVTLALGSATMPVAAQDASPVASPVAAASPLDLAAMTLTIDDLADVGYADFLVADGRTQSLDDRLADLATAGNDPDAVRITLSAMGWTRQYRTRFAHPAAPGSEDFDALIVTAATQFATVEGAAIGFDSTTTSASGEGTPVDRPRTVGDESQLFEQPESTLDGSELHPALRIIYRHGTLVSDLFVFGAPGETLDPADIEALAERQIERMDRVLAGDAPDLSFKTLRWQGLSINDPDVDNYLKLDGQMYVGLGDSEEDTANAAETYRDATDFYRYEAALTQSLIQLTSIAQFSSADVAAAWVQDAFARTEKSLPAGATLETVTGAPEFGDTTVVLHVESPAENQTLVGYAVFVQFNDQILSFALISLDDIDVANFAAMAAEQVACFEAGDCSASVPLPSWVGA